MRDDVAAVLAGDERYAVACARAEAFADSLPDGSVNLLVLDPPYYGVKDEDWDNAWPSEEAFLSWMGEQCARWRRVLAPNGSLYVFAKPQATRRGATMGSRVEAVVSQHLAVVNRITWRKPPYSTKAEMFDKPTMRAFFPASEVVIFAEQYGADSVAMGEAQYDAKCDELRGFVFEPLRSYLDGERERAGFDHAACNAATGNQMAGHYFSRIQWTLPTAANYDKLRTALNRGRLSSDEVLRREYESLRREYELLRRPFAVTSEVPYTDVWDYATVGHHEGKHPCEKPHDMARDIVTASSRPGDVVADFFAGSGRFLEWAVKLGRRAIGCDMSEHWAAVAAARCAAAAEGAPYKPPPRPDRVVLAKVVPPVPQLALFDRVG